MTAVKPNRYDEISHNKISNDEIFVFANMTKFLTTKFLATKIPPPIRYIGIFPLMQSHVCKQEVEMTVVRKKYQRFVFKFILLTFSFSKKTGNVSSVEATTLEFPLHVVEKQTKLSVSKITGVFFRQIYLIVFGFFDGNSIQQN